MKIVFVVQDGWYDCGDIDSVWLDKQKAEDRAAELRADAQYDYRDRNAGPNWKVVAVRTNEPAGEIWDETTGPGDSNG